MSAQANGLTLETLAQKLDTLQRENAQNAERLETLERENAGLRAEVSALRGSDTPRDEVPALRGSDTRRSGEAALAFEGRVSRRSLLSKAGAAAVAAVAAGTLLNARQARADHYDGPGIEVDFVRAHASSGTAVRASGSIGVEAYSSGVGAAGVHGDRSYTGFFNFIDGYGVVGKGAGANYAGVYGYNYRQGPGVRGEGVIGVWGTSDTEGQAGVYAEHKTTNGPGVVADAKGESYAGVLGRNPDGTGVHGQSSKTGYGGITGQHTGSSGYGVIGLGTGPSAGVLGRNNNGYGGQFEGGKAQLMLKPAGSLGRPTSGTHSKGEIYMDSAGTLFVCVADGSPGKWKKLAFVTPA